MDNKDLNGIDNSPLNKIEVGVSLKNKKPNPRFTSVGRQRNGRDFILQNKIKVINKEYARKRHSLLQKNLCGGSVLPSNIPGIPDQCFIPKKNLVLDLPYNRTPK